MPQAIAATTTIPSPSLPRRTMYLPVIHTRGVEYFPEVHYAETVKGQLVSDIAHGQYDDIKSVIAVDVIAGRSWDASEEIARAVLATVRDEEAIPLACINFLEHRLGLWAVTQAQREAA